MPGFGLMNMHQRMAGVAHAPAEIVILVEQKNLRIEAA